MSGVMDSYCWIHSTFSVSDSFRGEIDRESVREIRTDRQTDRQTDRRTNSESLSKTAWLVWLSRTID